MKNFRFLLLLILLGAFMASFLVYFLRPREPFYQGRPLSVWLEDLEQGPAQNGHDSPAQALRQMGTNAMPMLVLMLRAKDSALKTKLMSLARKQKFIRIKDTPAYVRCRRAIYACDILGPSAGTAIPELMELLRNGEPQTGYAAARALGAIDIEAIPALVKELKNEKQEIRLRVALAMVSFKKGAPALVPPLLQYLHDPSADVRNFAAAALGRFGLEPAVVVPALLESLADPSSNVRMNAAQGLGLFGKQAQAAVPALLEALHDENKEVCVLAAIALRKIDPEAAKKADLK